MVNVIFLVAVMVILGVPLVQKEEDMRKNLEPDVRNEQSSTVGFDSILESFWPADEKETTATIKRTKKYMCYVNEAVNQNMDCALQCLKYLYACENI
ncbi:hypothetical protein HUJ04_009385 [Dendroctonus ponderosae]|nr:hypothetical protein HUJ04_009385 [Dendroctonus ponderosae]